jgi:glucose/arabinose dehydrogenase
MDRPAAMAFDPVGRLFYTEKVSGAVRLFEGGTLQPNPVITFDVDSDFERGLLGIAVDPDFSTNHYIYVFYTCAVGPDCPSQENRVVRFVENNGVGSDPTTIFASPQSSGQHNGGNIHFGPDGKLYISVGDSGQAVNAQDVTVPNGKIHRVNPDGTIPPDNPVFTQTGALPSTYAFGLRNSFDFAFDPLVPGQMFASENGPGCDDELNRIVGGYNYGWRDNYPCEDDNPDPEYNTIPPLWYIDEGFCCEAPTGVMVYTGEQIPQWRNELFMATYNTRRLRHYYLDASRTVVTTANIVNGPDATLTIANGPDGALWYIEGGGYETGTLRRIVGQRLVGHIDWQGRPAQPNTLQSVPVTLTLKLGATEMDYPVQATDASGFFTVGVGTLPSGTFNWRVKDPLYLANAGTVTLSGANVTNVDMGLMKAGDSDNNNKVDSFDFVILRRTYAKAVGDPGYDARADFTGDQAVTITDFALLKANFGVIGQPPVSPDE